MADNITLNAGSGGVVLASDDISDVHFQKILIGFGADGTWTRVTTTAGLPVVMETGATVVLGAGTASIGKLAANSGVDIGDVDVLSSALPTGAATSANQNTGNTALAAIQTAVELLDNAVSGAGYNVTQFAGAAVPIGAGTEAAALRVTLATDSTGVISIDDNGDSLTIDNAALSVVGEGVITAGTLRITQATDDDGVAHLATIAGDTTSLDGKVTACNTGAVVISSGAVTEASAADIKSAVEKIDDWDESDRCKVNPITGQAGIAAGTGAMGVTVPRVTLATDDPAVVDLAAIEVLLTTIAGDTTATQTAVEKLALCVGAGTSEVKRLSGVAAGGAPGADAMVAAVEGKKLLVLAMTLIATSTTTNTVYVDNADNDLFGNSGNGIALSLDADADTVPGVTLPYNLGGWFKTDTVNEAITLNTSAAQDIIWAITYIETD